MGGTKQMKKFLLLAGDNYYPVRGTGDWIGCYSTKEEAEAQIKIDYSKGFKRKLVNGREHDWYDIIDLEEWMNK
jgi:hypothetical protein